MIAQGAHSYRVREGDRIVSNHHQKRPGWPGGLAAPLLTGDISQARSSELHQF
jgi:hypothetical protein